MKRTLQKLRYVGLLLLLVLVAAACNPDDGDAATPADEPGTTAVGGDAAPAAGDDALAPSAAEEPPVSETEEPAAETPPADADDADDADDTEDAADAAEEEPADDPDDAEEENAEEDTAEEEAAEDTDESADEAAVMDPTAAGRCFVHLYDGEGLDEGDDNYRLEAPGEYADLSDLPDADKDWDDEADSLRVGANANVTVWSEPDFEGDSTDYGPGDYAEVDFEPRSLELTCD